MQRRSVRARRDLFLICSEHLFLLIKEMRNRSSIKSDSYFLDHASPKFNRILPDCLLLLRPFRSLSPFFLSLFRFRYFIEKSHYRIQISRVRVCICARARTYVNAYLVRRSGSFVCMSYLYRITTVVPIRKTTNVPMYQCTKVPMYTIRAEIVNPIAFIGSTFLVKLWDPVINRTNV